MKLRYFIIATILAAGVAFGFTPPSNDSHILPVGEAVAGMNTVLISCSSDGDGCVTDSVVAGNSTGANDDSNPTSSEMQCTPYAASCTGNIDEMRAVLSTGAANQHTLCVYEYTDSDTRGSLVGKSDGEDIPNNSYSATEYTFSVTTPFELTEGVTYWLCAAGDATGGFLSATTGGATSDQEDPITYSHGNCPAGNDDFNGSAYSLTYKIWGLAQ